MNEKFKFINASQGVEPVRENSFAEFLGEAVSTQSSFEQSVLTVEKIQEMIKIVSTPAKTRNPFWAEFDFKPEFSSLVEEDQKPDHIHRMMYYPLALPADRTAMVLPNAI